MIFATVANLFARPSPLLQPLRWFRRLRVTATGAPRVTATGAPRRSLTRL